MELKNKIAIITGGSRGIGEAVSIAYAKAGATVIIVNKNNPTDGQKVAEKINQAGGNAEAFPCDISSETDVTELIHYIISKYNRIDILVHCAGVLVFRNIEEHTLDDWQLSLNVNLTSAFLLSKAIVPYMKKQADGKIIFISSLAAFRGVGGAAAYSASKGGLSALARSMVAELASSGINVNTIAPGFTATPMNQNFRDDPNFMTQIKYPPSGQAVMEPDDIAGAAVFLASESAKHIHGMEMVVDGGATAVQ